MKYALLFVGILFSIHINAQIVNIPDPLFKNYLINEGIDTNGDGEIQISEAEIVDSIIIYNYDYENDIHTLEGIKSFKNLILLEVNNLPLKTIDVSGMMKLEEVNFNNLESDTLLAVGCKSLTKVTFRFGDLIDLSECSAIKDINNISASTIKLNNCIGLERIEFQIFQTIDEIDLSGCSNLTYFRESGAYLESKLDFSNLPKLDSLLLYGNYYRIGLENLEKLSFVDFDFVDNISITNCPTLENVLYRFTNIENLEIRNLKNLKSVESHGDDYENLKIINCPNFTDYNVDFFRADTIDLSGCTSLQSIAISYPSQNINKLTLRNCSSINDVTIKNSSNASSFDFSGMSSLKNINLRYAPTEINLNGCYNLEVFHITKESFTEDYNFSSCINLKEVNLGKSKSLKTLILQNKSTETLAFEDPEKLTNVCVDLDDYSDVQDYLNTFNDLDTDITSFCDFANGGEPFLISGSTYYDINNDSCKTSDVTLPYIKYAITFDNLGDRYFYSDENGEYTYNLIEGQYSYSPKLLLGDYVYKTYPEFKSAEFPMIDADVIQDFCVQPNSEEVDVVEVNLIPLDEARPGFDSKYLITFANTGNIIKNGDIKLTFQDNVMDFISSQPQTNLQEEGVLIWNFENLIPFETRTIEFTMNLNSPMDTPPLNDGDILNFKAEVSPIGNQTLTVYWSHLNQEIVNSFDPNDKTCLNGNAFDQDLVGDYLKYMIRFENTGTADAVNIVIIDTLDDTKFDLRTLQVINSSHKVETELIDNIVKFTFKDIYLPFEDATNDGYVTFKIKTESTLVLGDDIRNKAEIYFDFNFPIVTNTTSTVISDFTSIIELKQNTFDIEISPNPASESISIKSDIMMNRIELLDLSGKLLQSVSFTSNKSQHTHSINSLLSGVYFIKAYSQNGVSVEKIVIN